MGLDSYIYATDSNDEILDEYDDIIDIKDATQLAYWRKDYTIHNYFTSLGYQDSTYLPIDRGDILNCINLILNSDEYDGIDDFSSSLNQVILAYKYTLTNPNTNIYYNAWW